jgi:hypothetical protein
LTTSARDTLLSSGKSNEGDLLDILGLRLLLISLSKRSLEMDLDLGLDEGLCFLARGLGGGDGEILGEGDVEALQRLLGEREREYSEYESDRD